MSDTVTLELKVEDIKKNADVKGCPVERSLYYITEFLAGPMCGRCFPCMMGSYEAKIRLQHLVEGRGETGDVEAIRRIATDMLEASMCKKGKDTAKFIMEWMASGVFEAHAGKRCPDNLCKAFIEYRIVGNKCEICGACKEACKYGAILGEKRKTYLSGYLPYEIRQKRCVKCGECIKACPYGAIIIVETKTNRLVGV
ncbi:MAG: 4Fe-4S dicluster domain-containing protein [Nitrospirae bacterium]|nr:MAG: 4Fe-4S dicluster domain-containing protein [Nitrospirota bacterium]